jgi:hypothetical protein
MSAPDVFRVEDAAPIERWLRAAGVALVALHRPAGAAPSWLVNGQTTLDEAGLLQMANVRRRRAGLPPFVWGAPTHPAPAQCAPTPAPAADAAPAMPRRPRRPRRAAIVPPPATAATSPELLLRVKLLAADLALQLDDARRQGED